MAEQSCALLIKIINDYMTKESNNQLRKDDLTMAQVKVLNYLMYSKGHEKSLKEIEYYLSVAQSTAAGIAKRLETKQFVESYISTEDKRKKMIHLTEKGILYDDIAKENMNLAENLLLSALNDQEKELFYEMLLKIKENLNLSVHGRVKKYPEQ